MAKLEAATFSKYTADCSSFRQQSVNHFASYMDPEGGQGNHADHKPKSEAQGQVPQGPPDGEGVTLTARLIRSFAHRNLRHLVLRGVNLDLSGDEFLRLCREEASRPQSGLPPPFRTFGYDCCKVS